VDDRAGEVEDVVDDGDLVADEVGHEQRGQDREAGVRREGAEGLRELDDPEPVEEGAGEEREPRVQARRAGEAEGGEDASERRPGVHVRGSLQAARAEMDAAIIRSSLVMQEMVIYGVSFDMVGKQPIVLLKTAEGNKFLPIWIGHPEAAAILMKLQGAATPRPMTHDLFTEILSQLEARVVRIAVTELRENTFYALITVAVNGSEIEIDSRPSDAIALAVRAGAPIFAAESVIEESAIEFEGEDVNEEEVVEEFKKFLDEVKPDDFSADV
jgi:bifunctional DNase/RNase